MKGVLIADIVTAAAELAKLSRDDVLGASRHQPIIRVRHACYMLARETGRSYPEIGRILGRDHTTVIHGVDRARRLVESVPAYAEFVSQVRKAARSAVPFALKRRTYPTTFKVELVPADPLILLRPDMRAHFAPVRGARPQVETSKPAEPDVDDMTLLSRAVAQHYAASSNRTQVAV